MNNEVVRICPYCAEQIKPVAKVCPWCHQWLSLFSFRNPGVQLAAFNLCALLLIVGFQVMFNRFTGSGIDFSPYRNEISVVESRMNFKDAGTNSMVYVVAVITNHTDIAWRQIQYDVRFFNRAGTLIDARTALDSSTILDHGESAFRINVTPSHMLPEYDSYKVFVRAARDNRTRLY
jgi:hypothetical protein